jgi:hypothetical protein
MRKRLSALFSTVVVSCRGGRGGGRRVAVGIILTLASGKVGRLLVSAFILFHSLDLLGLHSILL